MNFKQIYGALFFLALLILSGCIPISDTSIPADRMLEATSAPIIISTPVTPLAAAMATPDLSYPYPFPGSFDPPSTPYPYPAPTFGNSPTLPPTPTATQTSTATPTSTITPTFTATAGVVQIFGKQ